MDACRPLQYATGSSPTWKSGSQTKWSSQSGFTLKTPGCTPAGGSRKPPAAASRPPATSPPPSPAESPGPEQEGFAPTPRSCAGSVRRRSHPAHSGASHEKARSHSGAGFEASNHSLYPIHVGSLFHMHVWCFPCRRHVDSCPMELGCFPNPVQCLSLLDPSSLGCSALSGPACTCDLISLTACLFSFQRHLWSWSGV